ncbi:MAG: Bax inhibitor-1/YccA family protein [Deltaproteobacteria bacterium]|nr:Bax inhibitor-1/YccA family protein [Deltaproteobacteria bacterium]
MSVYAAAAPPVSGPAEERHAFLKRTALWTFVGLVVAGVVGSVSMFTVAPAIFSTGRWGGTIVVLGTFFLAHFVCRKMVYAGAKVPGFVLAVLAEGVALGCLLLTTVGMAGVRGATEITVQALGLVAATAGGMLIYVWFSKGELKLVGAFLTMAFVPMLVLMGIGVFFPFGGTFGLVISAAFVLVSAAGLLYRLNYVVHALGTEQHVEGAYEITMGVLVLLWNIITLLSRLRR